MKSSLLISRILLFIVLAINGIQCQLNNFPQAYQYNIDNDDFFVPYQGERFSVFDWNFCKAMANKYRGNFLMSPLSLKITLILLLEGSEDDTSREIIQALHLPLNGFAGRYSTRNQFRRIIHSLKPTSNEYKLNLATKIFISSDIVTRQSYASIIDVFYSTGIVSTNFNDATKTASLINKWISDTTEGNINNMIDDENSIKDSVMVMMNVLFFKGLWHKNYFNTQDTKIGKFHETKNSNWDVQFMSTVGNFYYAESLELDAKILRIPYLGHKFSMYLILPRTLDGLDNLIKNIDPYVLTKNVWLMQSLPVDVVLPKFKFEFTSHLEPVLRELGIKKIFEEDASLNGIAQSKKNSPKLSVTDFIQKAGIEVNEKGTTAFAATEIDIGNKIGDQEFHADHPFMFYIEDETTGTILFMGRVTNPSQKNGATIRKNTDIPTTFGHLIPTRGVISAEASATERFNYFNSELFQEANEASNGNIVISPLCVKTALTILTEATGGKTRQELLSTLRLPQEPNQIREISNRIRLSYSQQIKPESELNIANRLWTSRGAHLTPEFNNILINNYGSDAQYVEFSDVLLTSKTINEWVRRYTNNHISSIIEPGTISPETQLLLTSALYFKGTWLKAFDESSTRILRCFKVSSTNCQQAIMMENISKYRYASIPALDADVVELPYTDGRLSMLILLPKNEGLENIQTLSRDLAHRSILSILSNLEETEILLQVPKFSIEYKNDLRFVLEKLGIKEIFDSNANFTGVSGMSARVGSVYHTSKIEINEAGTVAAAVTGLSVVPLIGSSMTTFRADRPFIFTVIDRQNGNMIFAGRVVDPNSPPSKPTKQQAQYQKNY